MDLVENPFSEKDTRLIRSLKRASGRAVIAWMLGLDLLVAAIGAASALAARHAALRYDLGSTRDLLVLGFQAVEPGSVYAGVEVLFHQEVRLWILLGALAILNTLLGVLELVWARRTDRSLERLLSEGP